MNDRRTYLKDLATQQADAWAASSSPSTFDGEMRVQTKNTVYTFKDGSCTAVTRRERGFKSDPTTIVGMKMIGWLYGDDPYGGLQHAWRAGAYAVLWRARGAGEPTSSVALTSATTTMIAIRRHAPPPLRARSSPPPLPVRASAPPPLPARIVRASTMPPPPLPAHALQAPVKISTPPLPTFGAGGRPPSPSHVRPRPQSMTRMNHFPPPPATPTPPTMPRMATPPPLPARARIASGA